MSKSIGNRIRDLRNRRRFKQEELAEKIGVSRQVLSNWERGYSQVDADGIAKLAKVLEVSTDYLHYGIDGESPIKQIALALEDDEELLSFFTKFQCQEAIYSEIIYCHTRIYAYDKLMLVQAFSLSQTFIPLLLNLYFSKSLFSNTLPITSSS